jgi:aquaporin Z
MLLIFAFGPVSGGGHFNPAVSVACFIIDRLSFGELLAYMLFQVLGAFLGAATYSVLFLQSFNIAPLPGFNWVQAASVEIIYTMMLCFVVLNCALGQNKDFAALAIGFVLIAGAHGGGAISGGCFNPAIALAIDVASAGLGFGWCFAYAGFEFAGAASAAVLYRMIRPKEFGLEDPIVVNPGNKEVRVSMLVSELFGTFILMVTVGLNVLSASTAGAWSIGAALMSMVYSLGDISGAHFNPAVTLATLCIGRCDSHKGVLYMVSQFLGGVLGAWVFAITYNWKTFSLGPDHSHSLVTRSFVDIFFTFLLCLTVLSVACVKVAKALDEYFGLAIGFAITAGGFVVGSVSGGTMNPAVTFGVYTTGLLCSTCMGFLGTFGYMLCEFLGGALAAQVFCLLRPEEFSDPALAKEPGKRPWFGTGLVQQAIPTQSFGSQTFASHGGQTVPLGGWQSVPVGTYAAPNPYVGGVGPNVYQAAPVPSSFGALPNTYGSAGFVNSGGAVLGTYGTVSNFGY